MDNGLKLNIGAGETKIEGYTPVDRKVGREAFPLEYADCSADEIYASHVLEHFPHTQIAEVLHDWCRVLKPGGCIRIAVPDFEYIARNYLDGVPINTQGYVMGGQVDENDQHKATFDRETLAEVMVNSGLERVGNFKPICEDCSTLPVSLNLVGYKPSGEEKISGDVVGVMSAPRFGPILHARIAYEALSQCRIRFMIGQGVYWCQVLSEVIEELLALDCEYILTMDYDTIFNRDDVRELYHLMKAYPEYDAICANQMKRGCDNSPLFNVGTAKGEVKAVLYSAEFDRNVTPVTTAHFGLTIFRATAFRKLQKPWMVGVPNDDGRWGEGKVDADIYFWHGWQKSGLKIGWANRVVVGHMEEVISWPDPEFKAIYQKTSDFQENGIPKEVIR